MGWRQCEKPKTVLASPTLVREFMEMEPVPHDRPLSEKRLQVYERILQAGEFRVVTWASVVCYQTNCTYRVNGKHTATLLSGYLKNDKKLPDFHVTIERYEADTLTDVASLYNTFDSNLASRTTRDINMAFAATIPALRNVSQKHIHLAVGALAAQKWDENEIRKVPPAERAEELLDNNDFVQWLQHIMPIGFGVNSPSRPLQRVAVVSAMLATYRKGPKVATEFWESVRDESAPDRDDPTRVLTRFLIRASVAGGTGSRQIGDKKMVTSREIYVKCVHAWNAWRKGERTALNYHAKAALPVVSK